MVAARFSLSSYLAASLNNTVSTVSTYFAASGVAQRSSSPFLKRLEEAIKSIA